ncbi:MAG: site-2 protease family protein [Spirochaetes bacterium]|nr:site-2 protease family protein [Spirochaetota bacterium]
MLALLNNFFSIIIAIFGFSILVFFHEFGHFIMAVIFKIKVEKFSIGMGPAIYGFKKGETFFQIGAVPFGGFCKFKGDETIEDLPTKFSLNVFSNIINKISSESSKGLLFDNYEKSLPEQIEKDIYDEMINNIKDKNNLIKNAYELDASIDKYILQDINQERIIKLTKLIENKNNKLLNYVLKEDVNEKLKNKLLKIISKVDSIYKLRDPESFYGSPPHKRLLVAIFGPFMNYIIAILFLSFLAMGSHTETYHPNKILLVDDIKSIDNIKKESPAKKAGLLSKDIILKIDDTDIYTFYDISKMIYNKNKPIKITINRDGQIITKIIKPEWNPEQIKYIIGISCYIDPIIKYSNKSFLQQELGLKDGDIIIGVDNNYDNWSRDKLLNFFEKSFSMQKTSIIHIKRNKSKYIDIPIIFNEINHKISKKDFLNDFAQNIYYPKRFVKGKNPFSAFKEGFIESNDIIKGSVISLYYLIFKPKKNVIDKFGGPIMIGYYIGNVTVEAFKESLYQAIREFFRIISIISLILAFFNLLPIPALDGGHVIMNIYEIITRKSISLKILYKINMLFFILLMLLAVVVAFLDISKLANIGK